MGIFQCGIVPVNEIFAIVTLANYCVITQEDTRKPVFAPRTTLVLETDFLPPKRRALTVDRRVLEAERAVVLNSDGISDYTLKRDLRTDVVSMNLPLGTNWQGAGTL